MGNVYRLGWDSGGEHGLVECFYVVEGWRGFDEGTSQGVVKVRANIYFAEFLGGNRLIELSRSNPRSHVGMEFLESIKTHTERSIIWQSRISMATGRLHRNLCARMRKRR